MIKRISVTLLISVILIVSGCADSKPINNYERIISKLTDEQMVGRLTGSEGNQLAAEFIGSEFKRIGLEYWMGDSFLVPYTHSKNQSKQLDMTVYYSDGSLKSLKYGTDFMEQQASQNFNGSGTVTFAMDEVDANSIFIAETGADYVQALHSEAKFILLQTDDFKRYLPSNFTEKPVLQISKKIFSELKGQIHKIEKLELIMEYSNEKIEAENVVGVIKGSSSTGDDHHAIVISAHFDSLGVAGGVSFDGAGDNASGVSSLLHLANSLKVFASQQPLYSDIIICAFNGEEDGIQGSRAFVEQLGQRTPGLHLYNLNLDTIGLREGEFVITRNEQDAPLAELLKEYLSEHHIDAGIEADFGSDHLAFSEKMIPAVTVGKSDTSVLHTSNDNMDQIDFESLSNVTTVIFNFILENDENSKHEHTHETSSVDSHTHDPVTEEDEQLYQRYNEIKSQLQFREYQYVGDEEFYSLIAQDVVTFESHLDLINEISDYNPPEAFSNYSFKTSEIIFNMSTLIGGEKTEEQSLNKTYRYEGSLSKKEILSSKLTYVKDEQKLELTVQTMKPAPPMTMEGNQLEGNIVKEDNREYVIYGEDRSKFVMFEFELQNKTYYASIVLEWDSADLEKLAEFISEIPWAEMV